ncbi:putative vivid protein [Xylariaceae sp. FL0255]|nr:putative vivid protein [Xylariaceae sp. FL0255]
MSIMNPWELHALEYNFEDDSHRPAAAALLLAAKDTIHDPIIYPGIYAPSGFDMMSILLRVIARPAPVIQLGPVDASCAVLMCDIQQPDYPVVYANEACAELTGYSQRDMLGRNCRFMQAPGGHVRKSSARQFVDRQTIKKMSKAIRQNAELAVEVTNFKKNGARFTNLLAMIPVSWDTDKPKYYVGFMAEKTW